MSFVTNRIEGFLFTSMNFADTLTFLQGHQCRFQQKIIKHLWLVLFSLNQINFYCVLTVYCYLYYDLKILKKILDKVDTIRIGLQFEYSFLSRYFVPYYTGIIFVILNLSGKCHLLGSY